MEITYIGHACFRVKGKDLSFVIDPYDSEAVGYKLPKLSADVVLVTHNHADHNFVEGVKDYKLLIDGPGEYEVSDVFFYGIQTFHDNKAGGERGVQTIYYINIDGFDLLHLGDLGHELSKNTLEKIPNVDVLMIPVGGTYTIDAKTASKVISSLEPGIVLPMHSKTKDSKVDDLVEVDKFLKEMGVEATNGDRLKLNSRNDIPEETEIKILTANH